MSSIVLDLQSGILNKECDLLSALRKAHLIAQKLDLQEFDKWINFELNGYSDCSQKDIPSYREIKGELKAWNPYNGWIPVSFQDSEIENMFNTYRIDTSIGDLINLYNSATESNTIIMSIGADLENYLNQYNDAPYRPKYSLQFGKYLLNAIMEKVKNCLLDWTINLENKGVLGGMIKSKW